MAIPVKSRRADPVTDRVALILDLEKRARDETINLSRFLSSKHALQIRGFRVHSEQPVGCQCTGFATPPRRSLHRLYELCPIIK